IDDGEVGLAAKLVERLEARAAADAVDGLEPPGRHQPRARIGGPPPPGPLPQRRPEGIAKGFPGGRENPQQADERGEPAPGVGDVDGTHRLAYLIGRVHGDRSHHLLPTCARWSGNQSRALPDRGRPTPVFDALAWKYQEAEPVTGSVFTIHGVPNRSTTMP